MRNGLLLAHVGSISEPVGWRCLGPGGECGGVSIHLQHQLIRCRMGPRDAVIHISFVGWGCSCQENRFLLISPHTFTQAPC